MTEAQRAAHNLLAELDAYLDSGMPAPAVIRSEIAAAVRDAKALPKRDSGSRVKVLRGAQLTSRRYPANESFRGLPALMNLGGDVLHCNT